MISQNYSPFPYKRSLYYVYKDPASAGLQAFLGYATSPQGQQALTLGNLSRKNQQLDLGVRS
ncbi:hypothetical protein [Aphanizomenon sp. CS-733/32]|uniref:hypothetical protein n=1 Tax=Aphanizomenon sp. CS-733/32 TaxID=3021715 RepID=UPI0023309404|nr:hypothetical protein [Aphanizomenon sp. CS-733/32]